MEAIGTILTVVKQNGTRVEYEDAVSQLQQVFQELQADVANVKEQRESVSVLAKQLQAEVADVKERQHSLSLLEKDLADLRQLAKDVAEQRDKDVAEQRDALSKIAKDVSELKQQRQTEEQVTAQEMEAAVKESKDVDKAEYALQERVWHFSLLIGLPEPGSLGSLWLAILFVVNALLQLLLCIIINDVFTEPSFTEHHITDFRHWRLHYAHSPGLMNDFTLQPFVKDICSRNSAMFMATPADNTLGVILEYSPLEMEYDSLVGPLFPNLMPDKYLGMTLSLIAIFIWSMDVAGSILDIRDIAAAFFHIPRSQETVVAHGPDSSTLVSVGRVRQVFYGIVLVLQFFLVVFLGVAGVYYICYTIELRDILLNCTALSLVMDIDRFMGVFVPYQAKQFLRSLEPLTRPASRGYKGLNWPTFFKVAVVVLIMIVSVHEVMLQVDILYDVEMEICGGNLNFVAGLDKAGVVIAAEPPPIIDEGTTYFQDAVTQLIQGSDKVLGDIGKDDLSTASTSITGGIWSLVGWLGASDGDILDYWNWACVDMVPIEDSPYDYARHFLRILREALQNATINSCSEVVQNCGRDDVAGARTRYICPITCGCADLGSSLIIMDNKVGDSGCPPVCRTTSTYNDSMWARECEDSELSSSYWSNYNRGLLDLMNSYADSYEDEILSVMKDNGCGISSMDVRLWGYYWPDACETWSALRLKSIAYACPVTCGCETNFRPGCPDKCRLPTV